VLVGATLGGGLSAISIVGYTFGFFMPGLEAEFGWGRSAIGAAVSIFLLGLLVLMPVAGRLADRFGSRRVALAAIIVATLAFAIASRSIVSLWTLYATYAAFAVGAAGTSAIVYSRALNSWFNRARGLALGIMISGTGITTAVMPFVLPPVIASYGWRSGYLLLAVIVALPLLVALPLVRERPSSGAAGKATDGMTMHEILRTRTFWILAFAILCISPVFSGVTTHLAPAYRDLGATDLQVQTMMSALGISMIIARPVIGLALDRFRPPLVAACALLGPGLALAVAGQAGPGFAIVVALAVGIGVSAESDLMAFIVSRYFGMKAYGEAYGWLFSVSTLGLALGPILGGLAFDAFGDYRLAFLAAAGLCAVGAAAFLSLELLQLGRARPVSYGS
jgi:MFS family permease